MRVRRPAVRDMPSRMLRYLLVVATVVCDYDAGRSRRWHIDPEQCGSRGSCAGRWVKSIPVRSSFSDRGPPCILPN